MLDIQDLVLELVITAVVGMFAFLAFDSFRVKRIMDAARVPPAPSVPLTWPPKLSTRGSAILALALAITVFSLLGSLKPVVALALLAIVLWAVIIGLLLRVDAGAFSKANKAWDRKVKDAFAYEKIKEYVTDSLREKRMGK